MGKLKDETRLQQKRCQGQGMDYIPWIKVREISSKGTSTVLTNWKTGRRTHLLSIAESDVFHVMNFRDDVLDIREQYALLDTSLVDTIAYRHGFRKPQGYLTTDLLLTTNTLTGLEAISVKASIDQIKGKQRELEKLTIEKEYWNSQNVLWKLVFGEEINKTLVRNISCCSEYFTLQFVDDDVKALKFMIIHRIIKPRMDKEILNFGELLETYRRELDLLYENTNEQERPYWIRDRISSRGRSKDYRRWDGLYKVR